MTLSTHCRNGHLYTPRNTIRSRRGHRVCRQCKRDNKQRNKKPVRERIPLQPSPWDAYPICESLSALWDEGLSTEAIAAELSQLYRVHITKNAVIGKAHRLHLTPRQSPIRR